MTAWTLGVREGGSVRSVSASESIVHVGARGFDEGDGELWVDVTAGPEGLELDHLVIEFPARVREGDLAWLNGYQSWSQSEVRPLEARRKRLNRVGRLWKLQQMGDLGIAPERRDLEAECSHEVLAVQADGVARLWGSRVGSDVFTILEVHGAAQDDASIRAIVDVAGWRIAPGGTARVAWLESRTGTSAPALLRAWAATTSTPRPAPPVTGWTSWYRYYGDIDAESLLGEIETLAESDIRFDVFQIDDGFQTHVGDWLDFAEGFPDGVAPLAAAARTQGMLPGLWLAPFVAAGNSDLIREHPEWVLRDEAGKRVPAGWNGGWKGTFYALDLFQDDVLAYLEKVFTAATREWGFGLLKLDFLYAAALDARPGMTRAQRMRRAMGLLRAWTGDAQILGCGVPLVSAAGLVEYCRIGADVAAQWEDHAQRRIHYRERVSSVSSMRSTIARAWMDGTWFGNDPDVVILRTSGSKLTDAERRTLHAVNTTLGSLVFVSDDIADYDSETAALLATWDPPGAARILEQSREGMIDSMTTDAGSFRVALGDRTGRVITGE
ncbi:glycoside hydrolase family 36 protein [Demequina salsinemoris]|uniref:glycoside hydrolase family 36 protein n=1 Tax=Demequina salsinemoris TaxID=577470 RepID=UPI000783B242|nr:glycoside hydrolase family 36 protein [Demequina salsinemoris]